MKDLRPVLYFMNMRKLAEISNVSYEVLRNYSCGRKQYLTDEEFSRIVEAIRTVLGGIR